jgi:hypothetical protein
VVEDNTSTVEKKPITKKISRKGKKIYPKQSCGVSDPDENFKEIRQRNERGPDMKRTELTTETRAEEIPRERGAANHKRYP